MEKYRAIIDRRIAGALFDFMGYLTTRPGKIVLGSKFDAAGAALALTEWANRRGLSLANADVKGWTRPQARRVVHVMIIGGKRNGQVRIADTSWPFFPARKIVSHDVGGAQSKSRVPSPRIRPRAAAGPREKSRHK